MIGKTIVIGFGYKARRGKDTAVEAICKAWPALTRRYAFADPLREQIEAASFDQYLQDGMPPEAWTPDVGLKFLCGWAGVPYDAGAEKQRALLQWWGMWRCGMFADYLVAKVRQKIEREQPVFALVADLRFANERAICDYIVRMDRPGFEIADGAHHISERELDALPDEAWTAIISAWTVEQVRWDACCVFERLAFPPGVPA